MKNNDQRASLIWLAIGLAILFYSTRYGLGMLSSPGPGFLPFLSGLAISGLALVVFFQQVGKGSRESLGGLWRQKDWPTMFKVMGALVLYALFLKTLGFLLVTFFMILYLFRAIEPMSWKKVLAGAFLTALGAYGIFDLWLEAQLPKGILGF
jgi:hypothetical protein